MSWSSAQKSTSTWYTVCCCYWCANTKRLGRVSRLPMCCVKKKKSVRDAASIYFQTARAASCGRASIWVFGWLTRHSHWPWVKVNPSSLRRARHAGHETGSMRHQLQQNKLITRGKMITWGGDKHKADHFRQKTDGRVRPRAVNSHQKGQDISI